MEFRDPPDSRAQRLIPVVRYAVERRIAVGQHDYWDYATLIELAALARDPAAAQEALRGALSHAREVWEPESTARNLSLIREMRAQQGESPAWVQELEAALLKRAGELR